MIRIMAAVPLPKFKLTPRTHYPGSAALYSRSRIREARSFSRTDRASLFELFGRLLAVAATGATRAKLEERDALFIERRPKRIFLLSGAESALAEKWWWVGPYWDGSPR